MIPVPEPIEIPENLMPEGGPGKPQQKPNEPMQIEMEQIKDQSMQRDGANGGENDGMTTTTVRKTRNKAYTKRVDKKVLRSKRL